MQLTATANRPNPLLGAFIAITALFQVGGAVAAIASFAG